MAPGRRSSFEITANGKLIWSKLASSKFPEDADPIAEQIKTVASGGEPKVVSAEAGAGTERKA